MLARKLTKRAAADAEILLPLFGDGLVPVVTGFIGSTRDGRVTTLGRNSSDFSGALIANVVDADELVIWTDVDGIFTPPILTSPQKQNFFMNFPTTKRTHLPQPARKFCTPRFFRWLPKLKWWFGFAIRSSRSCAAPASAQSFPQILY